MFSKKGFFHSLLRMVVLIAASANAGPSIGGYKVYYGDLHNHCAVDDYGHAVGTPAEAYSYAKNIAHLDFFGLSPHDLYISSNEWTAMATAADAANVDGSFITFRGFEWTTNYLGHITIVNSSDYCTSGEAATNTFSEICSWIAARAAEGCVAFFNHPGRQDGTGMEFDHFNGNPVENIIGIELWNKTDPFSVYYYNDGYHTNDNNKGYFDEAITRGWKVGASGAGDNHSGTWGTAQNYRLAVLANSLTRAEVLAALQARRFFSTLDKNIALSFKINGNEMGSTIAGDNNQMFNILATDDDGEIFTEVVVFNKNHGIINTWTPNAPTIDIWLTVNTYDGNYFYVKVKQADGDEAISSPIWISGGQVNTPPVCALTSPTGTENHTAPAKIYLAADASDAGLITKTAFYANTTLLGEDLDSPYELYWNNAPAGTYSITAVAFDDAFESTTSAPVLITIKAASGSHSVEKRVSAGADDAEEKVSNGHMYTTSSDLELVYDSYVAGNQTIGMRFTGCNIPQNATITAAYLQFTCKETGNSATTVYIQGEAADNAASYTGTAYNISSRPVTKSKVAWAIPAWNTVGAATEKERTPDLAAVVQEIVNRSGYSSAHAIAFVITGSGGTRCAYAYEGSSSAAPLLHVEYSILPPANTPPTCAITSPSNGATFAGTTDVTIAATAGDAVGNVVLIEFFVNGEKVGQDATAPFNCTITDLGIGDYALTAVATDDSGASTVSAIVAISVVAPNFPPTCVIVSPADNASVDAPVTISADATDTDGSISKVEFFANSIKIGEDAESPFVFTWGGMASGIYTLTAVATDNRGAAGSSPAISVTVNAPNIVPVCVLNAPENGALFIAPADVTISATAIDSDGDVARVQFFVNGNLAGEDATGPSPYIFNLVGLAPGVYEIYATAIDDDNAAGTSATNTITVKPPNLPPTCAITSPSNGSIFTEPASIAINASAGDNDGSVTLVEFFADGKNIGQDAASPYILNWTNVPAGSYSLTAVATDNDGATAASNPVSIVVNAPPAPVTVERRIFTGADDAEEYANGYMYLTSTTLQLVYESQATGNQVVGLRFRNLNIPQNAKITAAYVQFTADARKTGTSTVSIRGEAADNAAAFTSTSKNISNRARTSAAVSWTIPSWNAGESGTAQRTPNLSSIIQMIVNRPGYTSSSAMALIITGSGTKTAKAFEKSSSEAPLLHIEYTIQ